jgi:hypothetical protein
MHVIAAADELVRHLGAAADGLAAGRLWGFCGNLEDRGR